MTLEASNIPPPSFGGHPVPLQDTDPEAFRALDTLMFVIEQLRAYDQALPAHQITAFLLVALFEGEQVSEYAARSGVSQSTMSRHLLDLGDKRRDGTPGLGLVKREHSLDDLRSVAIKLTPKGRALVMRISKIIQQQRKMPNH